MPAFSPDLFDKVVALLEPAMTTEQNRLDELEPVLGNDSVYSRIRWEGARGEFTRRLVGQLSHREMAAVLRHLNLGEEQRLNIDSLCERIEEDMSRVGASSDCSADDGLRVRPLEELIGQYRNHLLNRIDRVWQPGTKGGLSLEKAFVPPTIIDPQVRPFFLGRRGTQDRRPRRLLEFLKSDRFLNDPTPPQDSERHFTTSPNSLKALHRAVISGGPGAGKTTLLRYLAWRTLKEGRRLPVLLELKTVRAEDLSLAGGGLEKLLFNKAVAVPTLLASERESLLEHFNARVRTGQTTVLLDGLDEVKERSFFNDLCNLVDEFCNRVGENEVIVSARPYALETRFAGLREVEIAPLSTVQIERFVEHNYGRSEKTRKLVGQLLDHPELRELARVPYLLSAMMYVRDSGGSLEGDRISLYRTLTHNLIVRLDKEKRVDRFRLQDARGELKTDFLCRLAYAGFAAGGRDGDAERWVLTDQQIVEEARKFCSQQQLSAQSARDLAEDVRATPLLREAGEGTWEISQRVLQEFLAASALAKRDDYTSEFCRLYFDPALAETEVLPMSLALAELRTGPMLELLENLPESLTLTRFRLYARAVGYGANPNREAFKRLTDRLVQFVSTWWVEPPTFLTAISEAFSGFSEEARNQATVSILPLLEDGDKIAQRNVATVLAYLQGKGAERALCAMFEAGDEVLLWSAAAALARIRGEETLGCMLAALGSENERKRHSAAITLGLIGSDRATDALTIVLKDSSFLVRWAAVEALGQIGGEHAMLGLLNALSDEHSNVQQSASRVLGSSGLDEIEGALIEVASNLADDSTSERERAAAIEALGWMGSERAVPSILVALTDKENKFRLCAVRALGRIGGELAASRLVEALRDGDYLVGISAAEELGKMTGSQVLPALLEAVRDKNILFYVQGAAVSALGKIGGEKALTAVLESLDGESYVLRLAAAQSLGVIGGERAITGLSKALQDNEMNIRWSAVMALGKIGGDRAINMLLGVLRDGKEGNLFVLSETVKALTNLGDPRAEPVLEKLLIEIGKYGSEGEWLEKRIVAALQLFRGRPEMAKMLSSVENKDYQGGRDGMAQVLANNSEENLGALLSMADGPDPGTQTGFWEILLRMDVPRIASGLLQALQNDDGAVRRKAAEAIGYYRRDEATCRELVRLASHDPTDSVKAAAGAAREQINFVHHVLLASADR